LIDNSLELDETRRGSPIIWLRLEGAAALVLGFLLYARGGYSWILFGVLFFVPDVSILGYLAGRRIGGACYNLFHTYLSPLVLWGVLAMAGYSPAVAIIWAAHVGFDRMLGFGLKYSSGFGDTHLGKIGRRRT
jgi:Domain of unknown function (DUF4260)